MTILGGVDSGGVPPSRRLAFLEEGNRDVWIRLNTAVSIGIFKHGKSVETVIEDFVSPTRASARCAAELPVDDIEPMRESAMGVDVLFK